MKLLHTLLEQAVAKHPNRIAFDCVDEQLSFANFFQKAENLAAALQDLGMKKGDRIAILAENSAEYIICHYATAMIGAILLVLNFRLTESELQWILNQAESTGIIVDDNQASRLPQLLSGTTTVHFTIGVGNVPTATYAIEELWKSTSSLRRPSLSITDPVLLIYTSGTTGRPKGALQTNEGSTTADELAIETIKITSSDVYLAIMPHFHQAGLIRTRATMMMGGKNVVAGKLDPQQIASLIAEKRISISMIPPPLDTLVEKEAESNQIDISSLRIIIGLGGAGPEHANRTQQFCKRNRCDFLGVYGQTETTGPVTVVSGNDYFRNPYTCGKPMRGIDVQIWDEEKKPLSVDSVGEIMVRGRITIPGYWKSEEGNKELYTGEWLHTGDLGKLDGQGFLYLAGRKKELIKTGGENVYPKEVENILGTHPSIQDLTIIGLPDPNGWGETVTAVIVLKEGHTLSQDELKVFCKGKIAGYKIPKKLFIVEDIPRNVMGKVKKLELRERFSPGSIR
jgi:fatty-acyl-CoA synthase